MLPAQDHWGHPVDTTRRHVPGAGDEEPAWAPGQGISHSMTRFSCDAVRGTCSARALLRQGTSGPARPSQSSVRMEGFLSLPPPLSIPEAERRHGIGRVGCVFTVAVAPHARAREQMLSMALIVMLMLRCWARAAGNHPARVPDLSSNRARLRRGRLAQQPPNHRRNCAAANEQTERSCGDRPGSRRHPCVGKRRR